MTQTVAYENGISRMTFDLKDVIIEVLDEHDIQEYSSLINEVMEEFNSEEIDDFQKWFTSIEGIKYRRDLNFHDGSLDTIQFAAKYKGKIIGAMEIETKDHIQQFFVKKDFHNRGVGKKLLNYSKKFFINKGIQQEKYEVLSSNYAIDIYKKLGFTGRGNWLFLDIKYNFFESLILSYKKILQKITMYLNNFSSTSEKANYGFIVPRCYEDENPEEKSKRVWASGQVKQGIGRILFAVN